MGGDSPVILGGHFGGLAIVSALQLYAAFQHLTRMSPLSAGLLG